MSRGRDDDPTDRAGHADRAPDRPPDVRERERQVPDDALTRDLNLPRDDERERVECRGRAYSLNGTETRALAAIGAFRVVPEDALVRGDGGAGLRSADLRHLADQGLVTQETITDAGGARHVLTLTADGQAVLEAHQRPDADGRQQAYSAGVVNARQLPHDVELYRVFREEADRIEREGGRVRRVILDDELKHDYQTFLHRDDRPVDADLHRDRQAFAEANDLPVYRGHLELPDLRIEYETDDGRLAHRDVELVTEHYSRGQLAGKSHAGFVCYRAGRGRQGGGTPFDPHHLERLV